MYQYIIVKRAATNFGSFFIEQTLLDIGLVFVLSNVQPVKVKAEEKPCANKF